MEENKKQKISFNIFAVICIAIFCIAITPKTFQNDTFYTIKIGELILENGIDMLEHFAWHDGLIYTYPHWLYDVFIYGMYNIGGFTGVYISTIVLCCILGITIYFTNVNLSKNNVVSFFLTLGVMYLAQPYIAARAQLVTFILFVLTIFFIEKFISTKKIRYVVGLVIIPTIIANVHAAVFPFYFVLYLPYIAEYLIQFIKLENVLIHKNKKTINKLNLLLENLENINLKEKRIILKNYLTRIKSILLENNNVLDKDNISNELTKEEKERIIEENKNLEDKISIIEEYLTNTKKTKVEEIRSNEITEILKTTLTENLSKITKSLEKAEKYKEKVEENPYKLKLKKNNNIKWLILIMLICVFTGLLTPIGDTPYTYLYHTMKGNTTGNISEHLPIVLYNSQKALVTICIVIAILMFTDTKIKLRDLFMLGGLGFLTLMSRRQFSMFIFVGVFILVKLICEFLDKYDKNACDQVMKLMNSIIGKIIVIWLIIICCYSTYKNIKDDPYVNEKSYPVQAVQYLKENLDIENITLYNEYNYGSYLLFNDIPVFIDSRADVYDPQFNGKTQDIFRDFINISGINLDYEEKFDEYGITHLVIPNNAKINIIIEKDSRYDELYIDDNFVVYERLSGNTNE